MSFQCHLRLSVAFALLCHCFAVRVKQLAKLTARNPEVQHELVDVTNVIASKDSRGKARCCCDGSRWLSDSSRTGLCQVERNPANGFKCGDMVPPDWATGSMHHYAKTGGICWVSQSDASSVYADFGPPDTVLRAMCNPFNEDGYLREDVLSLQDCEAFRSTLQVQDVTGAQDELTLWSVIGGESSKPLMVFLHGWPDSAALWIHQLYAFRKDYSLLAVTYPNFHADLPTEDNPYPSFSDLSNRICNTVIKHSGGKPAVVVAHDWGSVLGYMVAEACPDYVSALVAMDVGNCDSTGQNASTLFVAGYQTAIMTAYKTGSDGMAQGLARTFGPAPDIGDVRARMGYMYVKFWEDYIFGKKGSGFARTFTREKTLQPLLFLYGNDKGLISSKREGWSRFWNSALLEELGDKAVEIPEAAHWIPVDNPVQTNLAMQNFLSGLSVESKADATHTP